jgi:hypothetical protein
MNRIFHSLNRLGQLQRFVPRRRQNMVRQPFRAFAADSR